MVILALVVVAAAGWSLVVWVVEPSPPSAFYRLPAGSAIGSPGSILRSQEVPSIQQGATVWKLLYASTDPQNKPIAVSGVVVVPTAAAPPSGWPVVAWAHGTTGVASRCAPSLFPHAGIQKIPLLAPLIAAGTVVVATDYPGLGTPGPHPYLVGESEGRAVLDSIRAARAFLHGRANATSEIMGHSQGGHATLFAAQLAAGYAPELHVVGVAPMAPPTDLATLVHADLDEAAGTVLTALAVSAWSQVYPSAHPATILTPVARPLVARIARGCVDTDAEGVVDLPDVLGLKASFLSTDPTRAPGWAPWFPLNDPSTARVAIPMLVSQGLSDTLVRPQTTIDWVAASCRSGTRIELDTYPGVGHFGVRTAAPPHMIDWMLARLHGQPVAPGCSTVVIKT
jgi:hypothetical protein